MKKRILKMKKKNTELHKRVILKQIQSVQKEYNKISGLLIRWSNDWNKDSQILEDLKIQQADLEFQLQVLLEKLKASRKIRIIKKFGITNYKRVSSLTLDSLTLDSPLNEYKELTEQQKQQIFNDLDKLSSEKVIYTPKLEEEREYLELHMLNRLNKSFLNRYFAMTEEKNITENIRKKALLFLQECPMYKYRFQDIVDYSVLDKIQTEALDQIIFELKSNLSINRLEKETQPYYELFKRILRFLERDKTLEQIKKELPKEFIKLLLAKTDKKGEDERIEYIIITTISVIATAFSNATYRSYLDLSLFVGEQLLLLLDPILLFKQLDTMEKNKSNINIQQHVKETLNEYARKMKVEQPLNIVYKIGNLMIISFLKAGLLSEAYQEDLIKEYNSEFSWYKKLSSEQKNLFLKEQNLIKPGNVLYMSKLKEIIEKIPTIRFLYAYNLPSIAEPLSYTLNREDNTINYGGFISNTILKRYPLIKKDRQQRELTVLRQGFLDARNYLQKTPFSISIPILKYLINLYKQNALFQNKDDEVKQSQVLSSLEAALYCLIKHKNNIFYAPVDVDFRGRIYEICTLFSYQGPDLCRMLFTAPYSYYLDNKTIKLLISLCAIYYNKAYRNASFETQLTFFKENIDLINKTGYTYNLADVSYLNKKYDFIKICVSLRQLSFFEQLPTNSLGKQCNTLISLDAKSSGLQLISLLTNSRSLCEKVNIVENKEDTEDIYSYVAKKINAFITVNLENFQKIYPKYLFFTDKNERIFYGRNIWKKIIMIKGYAAGPEKLLITFQTVILEQYPHIKEAIWTIHKVLIKSFFSEILVQINKLVPEIAFFLNLSFLISTNAYSKKAPLKWKTLNQTAEILHVYNEIKETRYYSSYNSHVMKLNVNLFQKDTFAKKNNWAFPANLIQSCDATLLECILNEAEKQNISITCTAHDCLLIKITDYWRIQDLISEVIKKLFTYNNVTAFWGQFRPYIKKNKLKLFDKKTQIDKESFEKLIDEVSKNKTLFVLG